MIVCWFNSKLLIAVGVHVAGCYLNYRSEIGQAAISSMSSYLSVLRVKNGYRSESVLVGFTASGRAREVGFQMTLVVTARRITT